MCCRAHFSEGVEAPFVHAPVECSQAFAQWKACPAIPLRDDAAASTASPPNVRDDRDTPLTRDGMAWDKQMIWVGRKEEIFFERGLDRNFLICPTGQDRGAVLSEKEPTSRSGSKIQNTQNKQIISASPP